MTGLITQANISGLVADSQGAIIIVAQVTARGLANGSRLYALRALPIGAYTLTVEKPGFEKLVRSNLTLTTSQSLELDLTLEIGAVTESVNVVESKIIENMPIGDRRSMSIVGLTGAAVFANSDSGGKPNFFIDGGTAQNMRLGIGQVDLDPPVETVAEVKILANSYSAEYGGSAGGVIIATTKSGTNKLQGTLFEYFRNERLDDANYFALVNASDEKVRAPLLGRRRLEPGSERADASRRAVHGDDAGGNPQQLFDRSAPSGRGQGPRAGRRPAHAEPLFQYGSVCPARGISKRDWRSRRCPFGRQGQPGHLLAEELPDGRATQTPTPRRVLQPDELPERWQPRLNPRRPRLRSHLLGRPRPPRLTWGPASLVEVDRHGAEVS